MLNRQENQSLSFLGVALFSVLFVFSILFVVDKIKGPIPEQPEPEVTPQVKSPLTVSVRVIYTECENAEKIDYSLVELSINNGKPPYTVTVKNSKSELTGPYTVTENNSPVQFKVYGGESFTVIVRSQADEIWAGTIGMPTEAEICKIVPTFTLEPTVVESNTYTPVPNTTQIINLGSTNTPTLILALEATKTRRPGSADTATVTFQQITNTINPQASDTPRPQITDTPRPQITDTPHPQPTIAPTPINPNPRECEDGIDNDGDGFTDYPADTDCKKSSDPKEG